MKLASINISEVKDIGSVRQKALNQAGIVTVEDLLFYFPRRYLDRKTIQKIGDILMGAPEMTFIAKLFKVKVFPAKNFQTRLNAAFSDGSGILTCTWFQGGEYVQKILVEGEEYILSGVPKYFNGWKIDHPVVERMDDEPNLKNTGKIIPLYPLTSALTTKSIDSRVLRKLIRNTLDQYGNLLEDTLPFTVRQLHNFSDLHNCVNELHFPSSDETRKAALKRMKYEEFFHLQLVMCRRRMNIKAQPKANRINSAGSLMKKFYEQLPFELTDAQKKVVREIFDDLKSENVMNRMLQGDVGSGKTVVALLAMIMMAGSGFQSAVMAPTEILAEQHYKVFSSMCSGLDLEITLLTGSMKKAVRDERLGSIAEGRTQIVIGTNAIIQEGVEFKNLGLVIIDEQHRFGVMQRGELVKKAEYAPNILVMSATPIPRTLSLSLYGDLDISVIDSLPRGRKSVKTALRSDKEMQKVYEFIRTEILNGRQAYIVYPLIEKTGKSDLQAAADGFEELSSGIFKDVRVALLHGRMKSEEKDSVMNSFKNGEIKLIVSTTVIEVGVDNPNATVMLVMHSERFGLSQLHQLRGRVGRGSFQSYCILHLGETENEDTIKRVKVMETTTDGFKISEADFELRGPGEFFGERQSGMPDLKLAHLIWDRELLLQARKDAFELLEKDPVLSSHSGLRDFMNEKFKDKVQFLDYS
jgi:ATP-dependent DNA helicase RecG